MSRYRTDFPTLLIFRLSAFLSGTIVLLIVAFLIVESIPALREIGLTRFFADASWNPGEDKFGLAPMLWGTILVMAGAVTLATPLGIISAVFSNYYAPPCHFGNIQAAYRAPGGNTIRCLRLLGTGRACPFDKDD